MNYTNFINSFKEKLGGRYEDVMQGKLYITYLEISNCSYEILRGGRYDEQLIPLNKTFNRYLELSDNVSLHKTNLTDVLNTKIHSLATEHKGGEDLVRAMGRELIERQSNKPLTNLDIWEVLMPFSYNDNDSHILFALRESLDSISHSDGKGNILGKSLESANVLDFKYNAKNNTITIVYLTISNDMGIAFRLANFLPLSVNFNSLSMIPISLRKMEINSDLNIITNNYGYVGYFKNDQDRNRYGEYSYTLSYDIKTNKEKFHTDGPNYAFSPFADYLDIMFHDMKVVCLSMIKDIHKNITKCIDYIDKDLAKEKSSDDEDILEGNND